MHVVEISCSRVDFFLERRLGFYPKSFHLAQIGAGVLYQTIYFLAAVFFYVMRNFLRENRTSR